MTSHTKREHVVPQAHIKYFSFNNKGTYKVMVLDKINGKTYPSSIDDVACISNFYEVTDKQNYWENVYSNLEGNIPAIYNTIIFNASLAKNGDRILTDYLKKELSKIIVTQLIRTPAAKDYFLKVGFNITSDIINDVKSILGKNLKSDHKKILEKYEKNEEFVYSTALEHLNSISFLKKAIAMLLAKNWIVHKNLNYNKFPFVTSDNPVVLYNLYGNNFGFGSNGLNEDTTIIYYSINSELLIGIYPNFRKLTVHNNKIDFINDIGFTLKFARVSYIQCTRQLILPFNFDYELWKKL